jgi:hypothetical protein
MEFRRDEKFNPTSLFDEQGNHYSEKPAGFINFGDVSRNLLGQQCQYGSRLVDGALPGYPNLGAGLRFSGNADDYHSLGIHPADIDEFIRRFHAYRAFSDRYVQDDKGANYQLDDDTINYLYDYLDSIGAFDAERARHEVTGA